jgi:hypothetical protein
MKPNNVSVLKRVWTTFVVIFVVASFIDLAVHLATLSFVLNIPHIRRPTGLALIAPSSVVIIYLTRWSLRWVKQKYRQTFSPQTVVSDKESFPSGLD